jgi:hypothetical protein
VRSHIENSPFGAFSCLRASYGPNRRSADRRRIVLDCKPKYSSSLTESGSPRYRCIWGAPRFWNSTTHTPIGVPNFRRQRSLNASRCFTRTRAFGTHSCQSPGYVSVIITGRRPNISHGSAVKSSRIRRRLRGLHAVCTLPRVDGPPIPA